ncbi:MAG: formate dehydrogenase accessory protein FdhE [Zoogloeaceae bacterium]|nr:formate dehydrogenase accessory protein FdhE [Zoogloeaceae bacterium]MCK6384314.1 formate dehydrogenase accessory protein FdhE [Rhodocyclaceae bacterium]
MTTLLEPGQIPQASGEPPRVLTPDAKDVFAHRARRFVQLAEGHPLGDYLRFMSRLAQAQQQALDALPAVPVPDDEAKSQSSQHGMPLVPAQSWPRDPVWRAALSIILCEAAPAASETAAASIKAVGAIDDTALEGLAERVLRTELYGEHADKLPFVAAALQVYWTKLAVQLGAAAIAPLDVPGVCPCCGALPSVSVIGASPEVPGLRYLHCSLCNTEWHMTRAQCTACDAAESSVAYQHIEGDKGLVQAETCDVCKSYLKIVRRDKDASADPVADDLATLALDILVDESGYSRSGPNLLLVPGGG